MGLKLNELSPAPGAKKQHSVVDVVLAQAWAKRVDVVLKDKSLVRALAFVAGLKVDKCLYTVAFLSSVLPAKRQ